MNNNKGKEEAGSDYSNEEFEEQHSDDEAQPVADLLGHYSISLKEGSSPNMGKKQDGKYYRDLEASEELKVKQSDLDPLKQFYDYQQTIKQQLLQEQDHDAFFEGFRRHEEDDEAD